LFAMFHRLSSSLYFLFARNWITMLGASIVTTTAIAIIGLALLEITGVVNSPYLGILAFLILPGVFIAGLLLIPVGGLWKRHGWESDHIHDDTAHLRYPKIDFNKPAVRRTAGVVGFLTAANIFIVSSVSYKGVVYMDSTEFCGKVCHTVMEPEHTAYERSPHSRVECTECHIGPGAPWFVQAKLSGVRQVFAVLLDSYERPIDAPVHALRPSRDICEQCHWPEKFVGDRLQVVTDYQPDEKNTPLSTVLLMHIGAGASTQHRGIHSWHIDPSRKTRYYATDDKRMDIAVVRVENSDGTVQTYSLNGSKIDPKTIAPEQMREMDCIDCHNRPTHVYQMPNRALNDAMDLGKIDPALPSIKMIALEALEAAKGEPGDLEKISAHILEHYEKNQPELYANGRDRIDHAIQEVQAIYSGNVFPEMKVTWGTYPNHIGHVESPGCFRCHDDNHATETGETIRQDCTICHAVLAMQEESPSVLADLGLAPTAEDAATQTPDPATAPQPAE
jgi:hypothetical protein